jgi:glycerol-3-phosphate responsive antiterminator
LDVVHREIVKEANEIGNIAKEIDSVYNETYSEINVLNKDIENLAGCEDSMQVRAEAITHFVALETLEGFSRDMLIIDYFKEAALIQSCKLGVLDETVIPHWQLENDLQSLEKRL